MISEEYIKPQRQAEDAAGSHAMSDSESEDDDDFIHLMDKNSKATKGWRARLLCAQCPTAYKIACKSLAFERQTAVEKYQLSGDPEELKVVYFLACMEKLWEDCRRLSTVWHKETFMHELECRTDVAIVLECMRSTLSITVKIFSPDYKRPALDTITLGLWRAIIRCNLKLGVHPAIGITQLAEQLMRIAREELEGHSNWSSDKWEQILNRFEVLLLQMPQFYNLWVPVRSEGRSEVRQPPPSRTLCSRCLQEKPDSDSQYCLDCAQMNGDLGALFNGILTEELGRAMGMDGTDATKIRRHSKRAAQQEEQRDSAASQDPPATASAAAVQTSPSVPNLAPQSSVASTAAPRASKAQKTQPAVPTTASHRATVRRPTIR